MRLEDAIVEIAYTAYLLWLVAGFADFICHRRSNLPITSGVRESTYHLIQVALVGSGTLVWLALEPGWDVLKVCSLIAICHAVVGYLDTTSAYGLRPITPAEQHIHSILDMAPWIALGLMAWLIGSDDLLPAVGLGLRSEPLPLEVWLVTLVPAVMLVGLPVLAEAVACRRSVVAPVVKQTGRL